MKHLARATLTLAVLALLAAIWQPYGPWWAWLLTALLLFLIGAMVAAAQQTALQAPVGNATGPHVHIEARGYSADEIEKRLLKQPRMHDAITTDDVEQYKRREYGQPRPKEDEK